MLQRHLDTLQNLALSHDSDGITLRAADPSKQIPCGDSGPGNLARSEVQYSEEAAFYIHKGRATMPEGLFILQPTCSASKNTGPAQMLGNMAGCRPSGSKGQRAQQQVKLKTHDLEGMLVWQVSVRERVQQGLPGKNLRVPENHMHFETRWPCFWALTGGLRGTKGPSVAHSRTPSYPLGHSEAGPQGTGQPCRPWTPATWFYVLNTQAPGPGDWVLLHGSVSSTREPTALGTQKEGRAESTCSSPRTPTLGCAGSKVLIPMVG